MTANGLNLLINLLDQEDLLYYTEYHKNLQELKLDDLTTGILYKKSLVVVSQPLNDPSSKIVGVMFWDALLNAVLDLAPNPNQKRQKVLAILDETHRLPVGNLGNSGDFLRQYNLALVEITPSIVDRERWERNKHVYQTIISLTPGVNEIASLIYERLPNYQAPLFNNSIGLDTNADGSLKISPKVQVNDSQQQIGQDNPGVSLRSMLSTGKFTALLQSNKIPEGVFWLDLESSLLSKFDELLADALAGNQVAAKIVDYTLGLVKSYES